MEQLAKSSEMMRTVCMGKTKPPMDQVEGLGQGKFAEGKEIMCYSNCVLEMMGAVSFKKKRRENSTEFFLLTDAKGQNQRRWGHQTGRYVDSG